MNRYIENMNKLEPAEPAEPAEPLNNPSRPIRSELVVLRIIVRALRLAVIKLKLQKKFIYGKNVSIGGKYVLLPPTYLHLGDNIGIGRGFHVESNLEVGDDTLISSNVMIVGNDHEFERPNISVFFAGRLPPSKVIIEGDTLIGARTLIIGNVCIGRGAIVGAGSVVVKDLPPGMVCWGVPAKPMRPRWLSKE